MITKLGAGFIFLNHFVSIGYIKTKPVLQPKILNVVLLRLGLLSKTRPITAWVAAFNSSATVSCLWRSSCRSAVGVSQGSRSHALLHHSATLLATRDTGAAPRTPPSPRLLTISHLRLHPASIFPRLDKRTAWRKQITSHGTFRWLFVCFF